MLENVTYDIRCPSVECGFLVPGHYFAVKQRFQPGYCPRCGSVVRVYEHLSSVEVPVRWIEDGVNRGRFTLAPVPPAV